MLQSMGSQRVEHNLETEQTNQPTNPLNIFHLSLCQAGSQLRTRGNSFSLNIHDPAMLLQNRRLIFFYNTVQTQYHLWVLESWPLNGTINYNTILQLNLFCKRQGKQSESPYVQFSFVLRNSQDFLTTCKLPTFATLLLKENPSILPATSHLVLPHHLTRDLCYLHQLKSIPSWKHQEANWSISLSHWQN